MNPNEYLEQSARTNPEVIPGLPILPHKEANPYHPTYLMSNHQLTLLHAAMGMCTESGEFMDQLKRHMIYGAELDHTNLKEEIGDQLWYIALAMRALDTDFGTEFNRNIKKLLVRFPTKFLKTDALIRDLAKELDILEEDHTPK